MKYNTIRLTIGGTNIPLNGYVKSVFISVILALIGTLRRAEQDGEITITLS